MHIFAQHLPKGCDWADKKVMLKKKKPGKKKGNVFSRERTFGNKLYE